MIEFRGTFLWLLIFLRGRVTGAARNCGGVVRQRCKSSYDDRYNTDVPFDLTVHSQAWNRTSGLYTGIIYAYDPKVNFEKLNFVTEEEDFIYPTYVYLNITVDGTRAYRQKHLFRMGAEPRDPVDAGFFRVGQQIQCDSISFATWEKDGSARNLKTRCSDDETVNNEEIKVVRERSFAYPIDEHGLHFDEVYPLPGNNDQFAAISTSIKCVNNECPMISIVEARYEDGERVSFEVGELTRVDEEKYVTEVNQSPGTFIAGETDASFLPMSDACLLSGRCYSEKEICAGGDQSESCRVNNPAVFVSTIYEDEDGDLKVWVIVAVILATLLFCLLVVYGIFLVMKNQQVHRYRYFFATRMIDLMETEKRLDEFTAEDTKKEYDRLVEKLRGEINHDSMYEFLSTGELGYMDWGDFRALWAQLNQDLSGTVSFLEFCSFLGHSWAELEAVKADRVGYEQMDGPVAGADVEEEA